MDMMVSLGALLLRRCVNHRNIAFTGQYGPSMALRWIMEPRIPFFWLDSRNVAAVAVISSSIGVSWGKMTLPRLNAISFILNCTVRVDGLFFFCVYSPTLSR